MRTNVKRPVDVVQVLIDHYENGQRYLNNGLCTELDSIARVACVRTLLHDKWDAFGFMHSVLTTKEFVNGLGPDDVFTEDRYHFLLLLREILKDEK